MGIFRPVTNRLQLIEFRRSSPRLELRRMSNSRTGISSLSDTRNCDRWWWSLTSLGLVWCCLICGVMLSIKPYLYLTPADFAQGINCCAIFFNVVVNLLRTSECCVYSVQPRFHGCSEARETCRLQYIGISSYESYCLWSTWISFTGRIHRYLILWQMTHSREISMQARHAFS